MEPQARALCICLDGPGNALPLQDFAAGEVPHCMELLLKERATVSGNASRVTLMVGRLRSNNFLLSTRSLLEEELWPIHFEPQARLTHVWSQPRGGCRRNRAGTKRSSAGSGARS